LNAKVHETSTTVIRTIFSWRKRQSILLARNDLFSISEPLNYKFVHNCFPDTLASEEESCAILHEFTEQDLLYW